MQVSLRDIFINAAEGRHLCSILNSQISILSYKGKKRDVTTKAKHCLLSAVSWSENETEHKISLSKTLKYGIKEEIKITKW